MVNKGSIFYFLFFWLGRGGKSVMHRNAQGAVCGTPERPAVGPFCPLDILPPDLPIKTPTTDTMMQQPSSVKGCGPSRLGLGGFLFPKVSLTGGRSLGDIGEEGFEGKQGRRVLIRGTTGKGYPIVHRRNIVKVGVVQKALPQPPVKPVKNPSLRLSNSEGPTNFFCTCS